MFRDGYENGFPAGRSAARLISEVVTGPSTTGAGWTVATSQLLLNRFHCGPKRILKRADDYLADPGKLQIGSPFANHANPGDEQIGSITCSTSRSQRW
jgi:hypothetical protein